MCVSVFVPQLPAHTTNLFYTVLMQPMAYVALPHFFSFSYKKQVILRKLLNPKHVFWFPLQRLSDKFIIARKIQGDVITNVHIFMKSTCHSC
jgi:hypothetical protein